MSNNKCKYCHEENLHWHFNILNKKWELYNARDEKHKCSLNRKNLNNNKISKEQKIWNDLKDRLDKEGKKVYYLKR